MTSNSALIRLVLVGMLGVLAARPAMGADDAPASAAGPRAGLAVLAGWSEKRLAELAASPNLVIHVLDADAAKVDAARAAIGKAGIAGRASAEQWTEAALPYPDNYVNLLTAEGGLAVSEAEVRRVLAPGGSGRVGKGDSLRTFTKDRPAGMDDWTHRKHGPDGNPVSRDSLAARQVPDRLRWVADVLEVWSHAMVTAGGRVFVNVKDTVRARDAYNGVLLWEGRHEGWGTGAAGTGTRYRVAATERRLYNFGGGGIIVLDAATGRRLEDFTEAGQPLDFIVPGAPAAEGLLVCRTAEGVIALDALSGKAQWRFPAPLHAKLTGARLKGGPIAARNQQLFAAGGRVYVALSDPNARIVGLDLRTGRKAWQCQDPRFGEAVNLAMHADGADGTGVLLAFNDEAYFGVPVNGRGEVWRLPRYGRGAGLVGAGVMRGEGAKSDFRLGGLLDGVSTFASCIHSSGLFWLREDLATVFGDRKQAESDRAVIGWAGIDPRTGEVKRRVGYPVRRPWGGIEPLSGQYVSNLPGPVNRNWSGRCYDDIGTRDCILAQTMEIVPLAGEGEIQHIRGMRGQCGVGMIVANNSVYTPPNQCIGCYPMIRGALAYETDKAPRAVVADDKRLEKGPAYGEMGNRQLAIGNADWPMYRHDTLRTSCTPAALDHRSLAMKWQADVGGRPTQPVVAEGKLFAALVSEGRVVALDAAGGKRLWEFAAGSRIDSSPTVVGGLCLFGCHDGFVYCLRASDGKLAWRFNAAPENRRIISGEQVESPWPVFGAVLAYEGTVYATAGHYSAVGGGLQFWGLDPAKGAVRFHQVFQGVKGEKAMILPTHWYKHEDHALNNVLCADRGRIRLYDQWGGWEFSPKDGSMLAQIGAVPQPGWPRGRISGGELRLEDRWVWAGWDRVTVSYLLRGESIGFDRTLEMDPRTRFSGARSRYMFFPDRGTEGVFMQTRGYATRIEPEPWMIPTDRKIYGDHEGILKDPNRAALKAKLWPARQLDLCAGAVTITGKQTLWVAGATAAATQPAGAGADAPARLCAVSMRTGEELASWPLPAAPAFEGVCVASGRLFIATKDGRMLCFGP
jgi:outer membrane protein assembly factor BamB